MTFKARDSTLKVFEFECDTVEDAIRHLSDYEIEHKVSTRCFEKSTGRRIIGGVLQISKPV